MTVTSDEARRLLDVIRPALEESLKHNLFETGSPAAHLNYAERCLDTLWVEKPGAKVTWRGVEYNKEGRDVLAPLLAEELNAGREPVIKVLRQVEHIRIKAVILPVGTQFKDLP